MTPNSNTALLCPVAEFLKRFDQRSVARLCSDTVGSTVPDVQTLIAALPTNANLLAALADASGMVESACLPAQRYSPADLLTLVSAAPATNATAHLFRLVSNIAIGLLVLRRPSEKLPMPACYADALVQLKGLCEGDLIFGFKEAAAAGVLSGDQLLQEADWQARNDYVSQMRPYTGRRSVDVDQFLPPASGS